MAQRNKVHHVTAMLWVSSLSQAEKSEPRTVGMTIRASGGNYNSETEGVLKLPDLGKLLLETEQANNGT